MDETRQSVRQQAACQAILFRAHCQMRKYLWRRWHFWEHARNPDLVNRALLELWNGISRFPDQALLATYLRGDGRQFCLDTRREAGVTLRFIVAGGITLLALGVSAFLLLGTTPTLATVGVFGTILLLPAWLVFLALEWAEYRTAGYLIVAVETAAVRLSQVGHSAESD